MLINKGFAKNTGGVMIVRFIQSLVKGEVNQEATAQGAIEEAKTNKDAKLIDVAEEALHNKTIEDKDELTEIVKYGGPEAERRKRKKAVKKTVWNIVSKSLGVVDDEMAEEITERIVEAAEFDANYDKIVKKSQSD